MDGNYRLAVEQDPDPFDLALLEECLSHAAVAAVGVGEEQDFGIFVREADGRIIAGASGTIWGGCCQIHVVWVDVAHRGRGLARRLLAETEAEARRRSCRLMMGITYDALTAGFYEPLGFRTVGVIDNCPTGTATRWYRKDL